jgi:hypothetical protein
MSRDESNDQNLWITRGEVALKWAQLLGATTSLDGLADEFDSGDHLHPNENGNEQLALAMAT